MASCSSFASLEPRLLFTSANNRTDLSSLRSDRLAIALHPPSKSPTLPPIQGFSTPPRDRRQDLHPRPSDGAGFFRAVIAATSVAGLSLVSAASLAMASDFNDSLLTSHTSVPSEEFSLSMAIPIPNQEVWVFSQNGFLAPLPRTPGDGFIVPFPRLGKDAVYQDTDFRCPQWRPSEFEMVLPDFQGRPKPFPRRGYHWSATFVVKGMEKAFLQAAFLEDGLAFAESETGATWIETSEQAVEKNTGQEVQEGKIPVSKDSAPLALGKRLTCFSL